MVEPQEEMALSLAQKVLDNIRSKKEMKESYLDLFLSRIKRLE
jgi:hypothetical protein